MACIESAGIRAGVTPGSATGTGSGEARVAASKVKVTELFAAANPLLR